LIYLTMTVVALIALASLAVDVGRVYVARAELQLAADAAARHAAAALPNGVTATIDAAVDAANDNTCDGTAVALDRNNDVEFGTWDDSARTFTALAGAARSNASAVRVTARRTAATGNAVPLFLARVIGRATCDVGATSVARHQAAAFSGIFGINGITMQNNVFIGTYNSAVTTDPTPSTAMASGNLGSNGAITGGNNNELKGNVVLGPGAPNASGISVSGSVTHSTTTLNAATPPAWDPNPNPAGVPQNYSLNSNATLPGGTYYFTSLNIDGDVTFSAPATLIVNGNIHLKGSLRAYNLIPANLKVYQLGADRVFDTDEDNGVDIVADVVAPGSAFTARNNLHFRGRMSFATVDLRNNAEIYYDAILGSTTATGSTPAVITVR
jgi:hypothetical protein